MTEVDKNSQGLTAFPDGLSPDCEKLEVWTAIEPRDCVHAQ